jgi:Sugar (and other) transporter
MAVLKFAAGLTAGPQLGTGVAAPACATLHSNATGEPLFSWKYPLPILLAVSIGMFNQLSGINAILYYLNDIFAYAGFSKISGISSQLPSGEPTCYSPCWPRQLSIVYGRKMLLLSARLELLSAWQGDFLYSSP